MPSIMLQFISDYAPWIYILSALSVLWALRRIHNARLMQEAALFSLEREAAANRLQHGVRILLGILALAGLTAAVDFSQLATSIIGAPTPPIVAEPPLILPTPTLTPTPVVPTPTLPPRPTPTPPSPTNTPIPKVVPPSCPDPHAVITSPGQGASIKGSVEIRGSAYLEVDFERYQIEYAEGASPEESNWHWEYSSSQQVINGHLYTWEPRGRTGVFSFRLRVVKSDSNWLPLCQVTVTIFP